MLPLVNDMPTPALERGPGMNDGGMPSSTPMLLRRAGRWVGTGGGGTPPRLPMPLMLPPGVWRPPGPGV
jgi:hypothetical protein